MQLREYVFSILHLLRCMQIVLITFHGHILILKSLFLSGKNHLTPRSDFSGALSSCVTSNRDRVHFVNNYEIFSIIITINSTNSI